MGIDVTLEERPRMFELYVGKKLVGRIEVFGPRRCTPWAFYPDREKPWEFIHMDWINDGLSIQRAARAILERQGYGSRATATVEKRNVGNVTR